MHPLHEAPDLFRDFPKHLADFVGRSLQWNPLERWSAASASKHAFLRAPPLAVSVSVAKGKNGLTSVVAGSLDCDVLEYLQQRPS